MAFGDVVVPGDERSGADSDTEPTDVGSAPDDAGHEDISPSARPVSEDRDAQDTTAGEDAVVESLSAIRDDLATLGLEVARMTSHAEVRERVILSQNAELEALRTERRGGDLRPLVVGLQKLRAELLAEAPEDPAARATFVYYADEVEAVLERVGVERLELSAGDPFDPAAHVVARTIAVTAERHRHVIEIVAEGWVHRDAARVLAPARVVVGRHDDANATTPTPHEERADA